MVGIGFGLFFAGYTLLSYGWSQLRGCNTGLIGVVWPGKYNGCVPDGANEGSPATPNASPTSAATRVLAGGGGKNPNGSIATPTVAGAKNQG